MRLIVGGKNQGKLAYALKETRQAKQNVTQGGRCPLDGSKQGDIINELHLLIRRLLQAELDPLDYLSKVIGQEDIVICDEVGCGIVPTDPFERRYREETGRICCVLAKRANRVERVFCGIATTIKKEK